ncbi:MAG TPA: hypothetical protein VHE99_10935 [Gammaproteobacteria bacterium]|nr:hypothetical protein [Gammaproteobacteria bacterium]
MSEEYHRLLNSYSTSELSDTKPKIQFDPAWKKFTFIEDHLKQHEKTSTQESKQSEKTISELWTKIKLCLNKIQKLLNYGNNDEVLDENLKKIKNYSKQLGEFTVPKHTKESFEEDLESLKVATLKDYVNRRNRDKSALKALESAVNNIKYYETVTCDF